MKLYGICRQEGSCSCGLCEQIVVHPTSSGARADAVLFHCFQCDLDLTGAEYTAHFKHEAG